MKQVITMILFWSIGAFAVEGKEVYDKKCASCHELFIPVSKLEKNFMQMNNKLLHLKAPTINQVVFRLKSRIGDPKGDEDMHRMEIESFLADYFESPDKQKSVCLEQVIKHFDTMPKMELDDEEFVAIVSFLYEYDPKSFQEEEIRYQRFNDALKASKDTGKMMMIFYTAAHCNYCKKMERQVMSDSDVVAVVNSGFIPVKVDTDYEKSPIDFTPSMSPTFIFLDEAQKIVYKVPGSWPKEDFLEILKEAKEKLVLSKKGAK